MGEKAAYPAVGSTTSGVAISTIVRLEKDQQKPTFTTIKRLSVALGVRAEELMGATLEDLEAGTEVGRRSKPNPAVETIRGSWKKKPGEASIVDAFLADRKEQALREAEEKAS